MASSPPPSDEEVRNYLVKYYSEKDGTTEETVEAFEQKWEPRHCDHVFQAIGPRRGFCTKCDLDAAIDVDGAITWCKGVTK